MPALHVRRHAAGYHEWPSSTPIIDAVVTVSGVASVVIGGHALLFLALALLHGNDALAAKNALFIVGILVVNGLIDALRHWRRHHG
jgi:hypothetical protein